MPYTGTRSYAAKKTAATTSFSDLSNINLTTDATAVLAYWSAGALVAVTTVESNAGQIKFTYDGQTIIGPFSCGPLQSNGAATNESGVPRMPDIWRAAVDPASRPRGLAGKTIVAAAKNSALGTPTNAISVAAGVVTWEGPLPDTDTIRDIQAAIAAYDTLPFTNGNVASAATVVTADATVIGSDIKVPADASEICGFSTSYSVDGALTAGAEVCGWVDFTSSISGFGTQSVPLAPMDASLGTAVGAPTSPNVVKWPALIPTGGVAATVTCTVRLNVTIDGATMEAGVFWR